MLTRLTSFSARSPRRPSPELQASQNTNHRRHDERRASTTNVEQLIRETHRILTGFHVRLSPSRVSREVRTYCRDVAAKGVPFSVYLANVIELQAQTQARLDEAYDRTTYRDPTGNKAVRNILRERGDAA